MPTKSVLPLQGFRHENVLWLQNKYYPKLHITYYPWQLSKTTFLSHYWDSPASLPTLPCPGLCYFSALFMVRVPKIILGDLYLPHLHQNASMITSFPPHHRSNPFGRLPYTYPDIYSYLRPFVTLMPLLIPFSDIHLINAGPDNLVFLEWVFHDSWIAC